MQKEQERVKIEASKITESKSQAHAVFLLAPRLTRTDSKNRETYSWLSSIDHEKMHKKASSLAHTGSGQWLINSNLVKQWD